MLVFAALLISGLYFGFNLALWYGWKKIKRSEKCHRPTVRVSVVVVVRNEEENIANLLMDISGQSYPKDLFEVIVIDDHSEDGTIDCVKDFQQKSSFSLILSSLSHPTRAPKKSAIEWAVSMAKGELLLVTDGDCRLKESWIESMARAHEVSGAQFIAGPVTFFAPKSLVEKLLVVEFASLVGAGAACVYFQKPVMCNAANMGFTRRAFLEVEGFSGNEDSASGDDVFLMQKIADRFRGGVIFNKDHEALVSTSPERSFKSFYFQRVRWAGKWKKVKGIENRIVPLFIFLCHAITLFIIVGVIASKLSLWVLPTVLVVKFAGEFLFLNDVVRFLGHRISAIHYLTASLLYPAYALLMGVAANVSGYKWKGRRYD